MPRQRLVLGRRRRSARSEKRQHTSGLVLRVLGRSLPCLATTSTQRCWRAATLMKMTETAPMTQMMHTEMTQLALALRSVQPVLAALLMNAAQWEALVGLPRLHDRPAPHQPPLPLPVDLVLVLVRVQAWAASGGTLKWKLLMQLRLELELELGGRVLPLL